MTLGCCTSWKSKKYTLFGVDWSYEAAMIAKSYEVALEAGLQTLIMTYVHMTTGWMSLNVFKDLTKAYMQEGGTSKHLNYLLLIHFCNTIQSKIYYCAS